MLSLQRCSLYMSYIRSTLYAQVSVVIHVSNVGCMISAMQQRASEREKLRKEREERKQKLEEERLVGIISLS